LAHSKSALKRWRQSLARRERNRSIKSRTRTVLGKALAAIQDDASTAEEAVRAAVSALDRAAQQGIIHDNAAARGKSRLLKRYNLAVASNVATAAASAAEPEAKPKTTRARSTKAAASEKPAPRTRGGRTKKS
jgi:small subunit ribosomal protein S20